MYNYYLCIKFLLFKVCFFGDYITAVVINFAIDSTYTFMWNYKASRELILKEELCLIYREISNNTIVDRKRKKRSFQW